MDKWKKVRLGDIADICLGKMLDKEKNKGELQPYLANINVRWGSFDLTNLNKMRFEESEKDRYGLQFGDIVMCEGGEPGRCAIWKEAVPNMKIQKALHRIRMKGDYNTSFTYYRFLLAGKTGEIEKQFIGSTIKHLTGIALKEIEFNYPSLELQRQIAAVLSALDAKIELNNRINAELEAMAKTLYDYWFVQFDFPAPAASGSAGEGQPYKSSGGKMVWSEALKREIPEGWEVGTLNDLGEIIGGSTPSTENAENFDPNGTPWITPKDLSMNVGNKFINRGEVSVSKKGIKSASLTIMPAGTVLFSSRAPIGYMAISGEAVTSNQGFKSFIPSKGYSTYIVYYLVKNALPIIVNHASGSTFKEVSGSVLKSIKICLPSKDVAKALTESLDPIFKKQNNIEIQNQTLTALRDWLLPMLMNGQVRVEAMEENVLAMAAEPAVEYKKG